MRPKNQYLLSLPERVLRSASALAAGLVREIGNVTLPKAVRRTRLYQTMVETTLRFLIEQVGQVEGCYPAEGKLAENFLLQRTVGDGIDLAGLAAFHASPVWVLAALADISGAGRQLIDEIMSSLKDEALLDRNTNFESVDACGSRRSRQWLRRLQRQAYVACRPAGRRGHTVLPRCLSTRRANSTPTCRLQANSII